MSSENKTRNGIITGLILPIIAGLVVEFVSSIPIFEPTFFFFVNLLAFDLSIPFWLLVLIIGSIILITKKTYDYLNKEDSEPNYKNYTFDEISGINWQWDWDGRKMENLVPLCPECSYQPFLELDFNLNHITDEDFRKSIRASLVKCDSCDFEKKFQYEPEILKSKVTREIHRRIRKGEYETAT
jgi:hypothetical protein